MPYDCRESEDNFGDNPQSKPMPTSGIILTNSENELMVASHLAEEYVKRENLQTGNQDRDERNLERELAKAVVRQIAALSPLAVAHFCQQVVSYCESTHKASSILTGFTHRLKRVMEGD